MVSAGRTCTAVHLGASSAEMRDPVYMWELLVTHLGLCWGEAIVRKEEKKNREGCTCTAFPCVICGDVGVHSMQFLMFACISMPWEVVRIRKKEKGRDTPALCVHAPSVQREEEPEGHL